MLFFLVFVSYCHRPFASERSNSVRLQPGEQLDQKTAAQKHHSVHHTASNYSHTQAEFLKNSSVKASEQTKMITYGRKTKIKTVISVLYAADHKLVNSHAPFATLKSFLGASC